jgi:GntP family gluconate:H+ symporter
MGSSSLLLLAGAAVVLLVFLVTWRQWNAFIALLAAALVVGCGVGFGPLATLKHFQDGLGATVGGIAAVIGLGAMLGKLLSESGAAEVLAARFSAFFGPKRVGWCVAALAVSVGLVTWFAVGLLLLLPVIATLSRETKRPFLMLAIPLLAFLSVMHGLMPPHPGPVTAIAALGANTGAVLGWGFLIGMPTAAVAGPLFARLAVKRVTAAAPVLAVERVEQMALHSESFRRRFLARAKPWILSQLPAILESSVRPVTPNSSLGLESNIRYMLETVAWRAAKGNA